MACWRLTVDVPFDAVAEDEVDDLVVLVTDAVRAWESPDLAALGAAASVALRVVALDAEGREVAPS